MATWHQMQVRNRPGFKLYHETEWSLVIDPPGRLCGIVLFRTKEAAEAHLKALKEMGGGQHSYILAPATEEKTNVA